MSVRRTALGLVAAAASIAACASFGQATPDETSADAGPALVDAASPADAAADATGDAAPAERDPTGDEPELIGTDAVRVKPVGLAVDATSLYVGIEGGVTTRSKTSADGFGTALYQGRSSVGYLLAAGGALYWTEMGSGLAVHAPAAGGPITAQTGNMPSATGIAFDPATKNLWVAAYNDDGALYRVTFAGGAAASTKVRSFPTAYPEGLAFDTGRLYVALFESHAVISIDPAAPSAVTTLAGGIPGHPAGLAVDASSIYVTTQSPPGVYRIPKTGGAVVKLADTDGVPTGIATDDAYVYWVSQGKPAKLWRKAK